MRDFRQRAQHYMETKGWKQLEDMASDVKGPHRFRAIELLAAYAYGHPTQPLSGDPDADMEPVRVTVVFDRPGEHDTSEINGRTGASVP